jgi:hypothetical protein
MHIKTTVNNSNAVISLKSLFPGGIRTWDYLFLRRMRYPLRHNARANLKSLTIMSRFDIVYHWSRNWTKNISWTKFNSDEKLGNTRDTVFVPGIFFAANAKVFFEYCRNAQKAVTSCVRPTLIWVLPFSIFALPRKFDLRHFRTLSTTTNYIHSHIGYRFLLLMSLNRVCQMVCFQTKNPNLGRFCRALELKMLIYFMIIWNILQPSGIFYGH